jgi:hypothetical protein
VKLKGLAISDNGGRQIEIVDNARAVITGCEISGSVEGIAVFVEGGGFAELTDALIHDERQSGVVVGEGGLVKCENCAISKCAIGGVSLLAGGSGIFNRNRIEDIPGVGIVVTDGSPQITENYFRKCGTYAIHVEVGAEPQVIDNTFLESKGDRDINRR